MGNENINPGQWQQNKPLGTGEGESPIVNTAQNPRVEARTMGSDISSIQTGGDTTPKTYAPQPAPTVASPGASAEKTTGLGPQSFELPKIDLGSQEPSTEPAKKKGGVFVALVVFIVIVGLAALGYFVIYPLFFGESEPTPMVSTAPESQTPPVVPPAEEAPATTTATTTPEAPAPEPEKPAHVSVFKTPADTVMESAAVLTGSSLASITLSSEKKPGLTEVTYREPSGTLVSFKALMQAIFGSDVSSDVLATAFPEANTSGFIYTDANGNRALGIIAQAGSSASLAEIKPALAQAFESGKSLTNVFVSDPGTPGLWKDGQTNGVANRYLTFSNPGFSINYGWSGNVLVISGSYEGFKTTLQHLQ